MLIFKGCSEVARQLAPLVPADAEVLAGLELGGIPVVTMLSAATGLPAAFVRKTAKPYGTCKLAEGADVSGRQVCIVEDVVSTAGQVRASAVDLRRLGARVHTLLCVIERDPRGSANLAAEGLALKALFPAERVPAETGADIS